jgi:hypothetical protein
MKPYGLTVKAYDYYRTNVKGNENITYEMARRKLTRNALLGKYIDTDEYGRKLIYYGNLSIIVDKDNTIVWLKNYPKQNFHFNVDKAEYERLNRKLGIVEKPGLIDWLKSLFSLAEVGR